MSAKYYVLPEERDVMQRRSILQAIANLQCPVSIYEELPGEDPRLNWVKETVDTRCKYCNFMWNLNNSVMNLGHYEARLSGIKSSQISLCQCGLYNVVSVIENNGHTIKMVGGNYRIRERILESEKQHKEFIQKFDAGEQSFLQAEWERAPQVSETEVETFVMRELAVAGRSYLTSLTQLSSFRYEADRTTHDVVIALQALIADIEILKVDLKQTFGIGPKWEKRFENLIEACENHNKSLEKSLELDKPKYVKQSVHKLVHDSTALYTQKARSKAVDFKIDLESAKDEHGRHQVVTIRVDVVKMQQAFRNLVDNAVKYSFSGTAENWRWIDITGRFEAINRIEGYSVTVSNLGVGIEPDEIQRVFEPGYQGRRRINESLPGHGLGLTNVKNAIEQHGGRIWITSQPQQRSGWLTKVKIWLPLIGKLS